METIETYYNLTSSPLLKTFSLLFTSSTKLQKAEVEVPVRKWKTFYSLMYVFGLFKNF